MSEVYNDARKKERVFGGGRCWLCAEREPIRDGLALCQECRDNLKKSAT